MESIARDVRASASSSFRSRFTALCGAIVEGATDAPRLSASRWRGAQCRSPPWGSPQWPPSQGRSTVSLYTPFTATSGGFAGGQNIPSRDPLAKAQVVRLIRLADDRRRMTEHRRRTREPLPCPLPTASLVADAGRASDQYAARRAGRFTSSTKSTGRGRFRSARRRCGGSAAPASRRQVRRCPTIIGGDPAVRDNERLSIGQGDCTSQTGPTLAGNGRP